MGNGRFAISANPDGRLPSVDIKKRGCCVELLGMDGCAAPGGKLARVRRCCRHVLALAGPPASADDLLPRLIFTVSYRLTILHNSRL
ncbi:hypothetical protein RR48_00006 [Papilio machaon]|uniref:Uncharacterized protein n=1 Tax=Papilio machaon TaxID=76193 RepID=A0A0N0PFC8_PAPMA|nr:hypothetical protein RR48_00006 [Papilio machaon]